MTRAFTHRHDFGGSDGWKHHKAETRARMHSLPSGDQTFVWRVPEGSEERWFWMQQTFMQQERSGCLYMAALMNNHTEGH